MPEVPKSPSPRRRFIQKLAGGTAALAVGGASAKELLAQQGGVSTYPPPQGGWDLSWTERVEKSKYRAVFDCADFGDGLALQNASTYMAGYKDVYGATDAEMAPVVVIRHKAIQMALVDAIWEKGGYGEKFGIKDGEGPALRNIWTARKNADGTSARNGQLDGLIARGAIVLCCNLALMRAAGEYARGQSVPVDEARKLFIDSLVPGIVRQTNGVFAVTRAQMAGAPLIKST
jgi:hypothetical protein